MQPFDVDDPLSSTHIIRTPESYHVEHRELGSAETPPNRIVMKYAPFGEDGAKTKKRPVRSRNGKHADQNAEDGGSQADNGCHRQQLLLVAIRDLALDPLKCSLVSGLVRLHAFLQEVNPVMRFSTHGAEHSWPRERFQIQAAAETGSSQKPLGKCW